MRKSFLAFTFVCLAALAFAQSLPLSVGFGGNFSPVFSITKAEASGASDSATTSNMTYGAKVFFDAKYIEAGLGIAANSKSYSIDGESADGFNGTWLAITALGKYPVELGSFILFPMLGIEYDLNLSYKDGTGTDIKSDFEDAGYSANQFWIKGGIGADFSVSEKLYIRPEVLIGYKFNSKYEKDVIEAYEAVSSGLDVSITTIKIDLSLAIGYKL